MKRKNDSCPLDHLAIIMDGNARWAKHNNLDTSDGHKAGAEAAHRIVQASLELGVPYLTLYAFSSENWQRPGEEVSMLMQLLEIYIQNQTQNLHDNNIKLKIIGNKDRLPKGLSDLIESATNLTKYNKDMTLCIALSYGGKQEIIDTCQKIIDHNIKHVDEDIFRSHMYDPEMPDVDLIIRPSGMYRISNFLIWQAAYSELYFLDKFWPDCSKNDLIISFERYQTRIRNFGKRLK